MRLREGECGRAELARQYGVSERVIRDVGSVSRLCAMDPEALAVLVAFAKHAPGAAAVEARMRNLARRPRHGRRVKRAEQQPRAVQESRRAHGNAIAALERRILRRMRGVTADLVVTGRGVEAARPPVQQATGRTSRWRARMDALAAFEVKERKGKAA